MCGWLCTLYDGVLWLRKWPSLITSALDHVVWVCAQGNCCRCIFVLYCVHNHCNVIVLIHVTWVTLVSTYMRHASTCLMFWRASAHHSTSILICAVYPDVKPCWCAIVHQTWNFARYFLWKWGIHIAIFSHRKFGKSSVLCAMMHLRKRCWIFTMKIRRNTVGFSPSRFGHRFQMH